MKIHDFTCVRPSRFLKLSLLLAAVFAAGCEPGTQSVQPGRPAPDFVVTDRTTTVHLSGYRGRVALLNFWATWCEGCVMELPSLLELHHDLPDVAVIAVSLDQDPEVYSRFMAARRVDLIAVRDPSYRIARLFHSEQWPETYLIDRKGVIRRKFVGAQDWSSPDIRAYLKSL